MGSATAPVAQPSTETSLIERFLYPQLGPGQMWHAVASEVVARGGTLHLGASVDRLCVQPQIPHAAQPAAAAAPQARIASVEAEMSDGSRAAFPASFVFSTMPVPALIHALSEPAPADVQGVADGLLFRNFITVGVLVRSLCQTEPDGSTLRDNWIYIQEPGVRMTRLQIFNNWSPGMVADQGTVWLGLEYVCGDTDDLWHMPDDHLQQLAVRELESTGLAQSCAVLDTCVVRAPRAYPAYFGTYDRFGEIRDYLLRFSNLFPIGRNGMHRYNNQDHSMLTAMAAVDGIVSGNFDPAALWSVNTEQSYHESH